MRTVYMDHQAGVEPIKTSGRGGFVNRTIGLNINPDREKEPARLPSEIEAYYGTDVYPRVILGSESMRTVSQSYEIATYIKKISPNSCMIDLPVDSYRYGTARPESIRIDSIPPSDFLRFDPYLVRLHKYIKAANAYLLDGYIHPPAQRTGGFRCVSNWDIYRPNGLAFHCDAYFVLSRHEVAASGI
ncbi:hypothetical protein BJ508DRAFT_313854 [Ascobolus immersus RN42]|uniref:Uncharacterized protein n=1 Tax=Ascobolus immersus RN42 TaxID=1160509 RepID=A0A3N4HUN3_ASCIM|nr:hypothetical protein BJ508DRAFT_313854 [Ascobolus immersus RN42]